MKSFRERSRFPELDLTPLIDILFMLIIFFVLAASFDRGAVTVELPRGTASEVSETRPLVITVTKEGHFLLDDGATASPEETLAAAAAAAAAGGPSPSPEMWLHPGEPWRNCWISSKAAASPPWGCSSPSEAFRETLRTSPPGQPLPPRSPSALPFSVPRYTRSAAGADGADGAPSPGCRRIPRAFRRNLRALSGGERSLRTAHRGSTPSGARTCRTPRDATASPRAGTRPPEPRENGDPDTSGAHDSTEGTLSETVSRADETGTDKDTEDACAVSGTPRHTQASEIARTDRDGFFRAPSGHDGTGEARTGRTSGAGRSRSRGDEHPEAGTRGRRAAPSGRPGGRARRADPGGAAPGGSRLSPLKPAAGRGGDGGSSSSVAKGKVQEVAVEKSSGFPVWTRPPPPRCGAGCSVPP
jgi:biopolymer transport protein ExbD